MRNDRLLVILVLTVLVQVQISGEPLFRKGSYKSHIKGTKVTVTDVSYIDATNFPDTKYLKVKAKIPVLRPSSVRGLQNLETLKLDLCEIVNIHPGAFSDLRSLKTIALNDNQIQGLKSGVFNHLNISTLYLHRNQITFIETEAFDNITNLNKLKVNSNFISYWDNNWFKNTPHLTELFFRRNSIRSLPSKSFKNLESTGNKRRKINVYLSKNLISSIAADAFSGLTHCGQIWLDRNEIKELHQNLFVQMDYMEVLFLSSNFLTSLPKNLFDNLKSDLISLDLAHNNNITCLDYEIVAKVKITNLEKINKLDCDCVNKLKEKIASDGKSYEINTNCS